MNLKLAEPIFAALSFHAEMLCVKMTVGVLSDVNFYDEKKSLFQWRNRICLLNNRTIQVSTLLNILVMKTSI